MPEKRVFTVDELIAEFMNWLETKGYIESSYVKNEVLEEFLKHMGLI